MHFDSSLCFFIRFMFCFFFRSFFFFWVFRMFHNNIKYEYENAVCSLQFEVWVSRKYTFKYFVNSFLFCFCFHFLGILCVYVGELWSLLVVCANVFCINYSSCILLLFFVASYLIFGIFKSSKLHIGNRVHDDILVASSVMSFRSI